VTGRFDRHGGIAGWDQGRIAKSTAVIVGVGAIGNEVSRLLAMAGIGRLVLCDPDVVAESNLSRTVLFRSADIGDLKVEAASRALASLAPGTEVEPVAAPHLSGVGLAGLRNADLVLSCVDTIAARVALAARCNAVGAGLIDAGTDAWGGQVCYYRPGGSCLGCGLGGQQRALRDDPWSCSRPVVGQPSPASAPVSALTGAWQATMALRVVLGLDVTDGKFLIEASGQTSRTAITRNPDCPLHDRLDPACIERIGAVETVAELLSFLRPGEEAFAWVNMPAGTPIISTAPRDAALVALGVARDEIIPVARRSDAAVVRYLELGGRPA
jgi:molybdopterin/thiamine biosynthesis adenylyltransferase